MNPSGAIAYHRWVGTREEVIAPLLDLCRRVFEAFEDEYLTLRIPQLPDFDLWLAQAEDQWIGFKLGYQRDPLLFYSWLGGVDPDFRKRGIASELMRRQHEGVTAAGYRVIETRTRAVNNAMVIANLRSGFQVAGFEIDSRGVPVVIQRRQLGQS